MKSTALSKRQLEIWEKRNVLAPFFPSHNWFWPLNFVSFVPNMDISDRSDKTTYTEYIHCYTFFMNIGFLYRKKSLVAFKNPRSLQNIIFLIIFYFFVFEILNRSPDTEQSVKPVCLQCCHWWFFLLIINLQIIFWWFIIARGNVFINAIE